MFTQVMYHSFFLILITLKSLFMAMSLELTTHVAGMNMINGD